MRAPLTPSVRSANANANANANTTTRTPSKHHRHPNAQQEVDPTPDSADLEQMEWAQDGFFQDLATSIPGIDEAMSFAEVMKQVQSMDYSAIVFDTAPTGHTLRLLNFPTLLEKGLNKLVGLKAGLGGMVGQVSRMMGVPGGEELPDLLLGKVEGLLDVVRKVNAQFQDPALTTFVCVCIPEFLSLYETERLVQELARCGIDSRNIVINQVIFAEAGEHRAPFFAPRCACVPRVLGGPPSKKGFSKPAAAVGGVALGKRQRAHAPVSPSPLSPNTNTTPLKTTTAPQHPPPPPPRARARARARSRRLPPARGARAHAAEVPRTVPRPLRGLPLSQAAAAGGGGG